MVKKATNRRRRLAPDQRIDEILDAAYRLVQNEGMSTLTMNKIALEAGSSQGIQFKVQAI